MDSSSLPTTYKVIRSHGLGKEPSLDEIPLPKPGKNQILIKMEYAAINPSDILAMHGGYAAYLPPADAYTVGIEGSGTVVAVGEDLTVPHTIGDRVHAVGLAPQGFLCIGTMGQYFVGNSETCLKIKGDLSFEEASMHFVNPASVYLMEQIAQEGKHKCVIQTAAASAFGRMLIRYFRTKGIKTINVVRQDKYIEELKSEGGDYALNSESPDFGKQLKELASKEGATLAFDAVAGEMTGKILRNMPRGSKCYVYGVLSSTKAVVDVPELMQDKQVLGFLLNNYMIDFAKAGKLNKFFEEVYGLLTTVFKTKIQKVFKLEDYKEAVAFYKENSSNGKILLKLN